MDGFRPAASNFSVRERRKYSNAESPAVDSYPQCGRNDRVGREPVVSDDAEETCVGIRLDHDTCTPPLSALQRELALMPDSESVRKLKKEIETVDQDQADFAKRIGLAKVWTQAKAESHATGEPADYRRHAARRIGERRPIRHRGPGNIDQRRVKARRTYRAGRANRRVALPGGRCLFVHLGLCAAARGQPFSKTGPTPSASPPAWPGGAGCGPASWAWLWWFL